MEAADMSDKLKLTVPVGATYRNKLFWQQSEFVVKPITGITNSIRPVVQCSGHGLPAIDNWHVFFRGVAGCTTINNTADDLINHTYPRKATAVDSNSFHVAFDLASDKPYTSGGEVAFHAPMDLTGYSARMAIKAKIGDPDPLLTLLSTGVPGTSRLVIDAVNGGVEIILEEADTDDMQSVKSAVFDLEVVSATSVDFPSGVVTRLAEGDITFTKSVTTV